jgi:hypothetical protein
MFIDVTKLKILQPKPLRRTTTQYLPNPINLYSRKRWPSLIFEDLFWAKQKGTWVYERWWWYQQINQNIETPPKSSKLAESPSFLQISSFLRELSNIVRPDFGVYVDYVE